MARPDRLVVVTGTGTEVGKTWVTAALARHLRTQGRRVAARKPAQSFDPADVATDASVLAEATGVAPTEVCPPHRWYPVPLAPPMAADALGRPRIAMADLVSELTWPTGVDVGFVEGAGGAGSPLAHDGDTLALIDALVPDAVLLVADPALGVVSDVRLAARAIGRTRLLVLLNRFDPADEVHVRSRDWLASVDGLRVVDELVSAHGALAALTAQPA